MWEEFIEDKSLTPVRRVFGVFTCLIIHFFSSPQVSENIQAHNYSNCEVNHFETVGMGIMSLKPLKTSGSQDCHQWACLEAPLSGLVFIWTDSYFLCGKSSIANVLVERKKEEEKITRRSFCCCFWYFFYFCFLLLFWVGVHCGIHKSSYNISNLSYLNSLLPPFHADGWGSNTPEKSKKLTMDWKTWEIDVFSGFWKIPKFS
jgi:uncharacterized membrane protein